MGGGGDRVLANETFNDGGLTVNEGVYLSETMKYLTSNDCLIDKGEAEAINTNENTWG